MQTKWEYKILLRRRTFEPLVKGSPGYVGTAWKIFIDEDETETKKDIGKILAELGQEGWELVAISPYSDLLGAIYGYENRIVTGTGSIQFRSQDYAGFTSHDMWVFKRQKS